VSGALVKAVLIGSTDFIQAGPLISNCVTKFCIEQGYGKIELANALPLRSYPATRRPADGSNLVPMPDAPANILVVDELWAGGVVSDATSTLAGSPYGVIELGGTRAYRFTRAHGGATLRAALPWHDAPGELLVNDLDLEVQDGDFDRSGNTPGRGTCGKQGLSWRTGVPSNAALSCGGCVATDQAYFDPNDRGDHYRRYLGNNFRDAQQFSHHAQCVSGTDVLDLTKADSIRDDDNPTEMVVLNHTNNNDVLFPTFILDTQGTGSEGFYKAVVRWRDPGTGRERAAPNTPCVFDVQGEGIDGAAGPTDVIMTTRDGVAYAASGVDDPATGAVDEARCDSTAAGDDLQVCPAGGEVPALRPRRHGAHRVREGKAEGRAEPFELRLLGDVPEGHGHGGRDGHREHPDQGAGRHPDRGPRPERRRRGRGEGGRLLAHRGAQRLQGLAGDDAGLLRLAGPGRR
jgi:hypothetical protein